MFPYEAQSVACNNFQRRTQQTYDLCYCECLYKHTHVTRSQCQLSVNYVKLPSICRVFTCDGGENCVGVWGKGDLRSENLPYGPLVCTWYFTRLIKKKCQMTNRGV